jgi:phosphoglycolate phosphatase
MSARLVVFDVDGTLVDSQAHILAAMSHAYHGLGLPPPPKAAVLGIVGLSLPQAMAQLSPELPSPDLAQLVAGYKDAFSSLRAENLSPLYPGAAEMLDELAARRDLVLGIATGKSRRGLDHILRAHGWQGRFATMQVADDHPSKPHPSMLHACLRDTGLGPESAVMVGDTRYDMDMAQAAQMAGIGVSWGYHPAHQLGARVIADFNALPTALDEIWNGVSI